MTSVTSVDQLCAEFRSSWQSGAEPVIREFLRRVEKDRRSDLAKKLIPLDVVCRAKFATPPTADSYAKFGAGGIKIAQRAIDGLPETGTADGNQTRRTIPEGNKRTADPQETVISAKTPTYADGESQLSAGRSMRSGPGTGTKAFGRFELKSVLGAGSFGKVFQAWDPHLERHVALKVPTFDPSEDKQIARFLGEAKSAARLKHPNIVTTLESGRVGDRYYIVTELIEGMQLSERLQRRRLPIRKAVRIAIGLADALNYAHESGVIHRDIKPENIIIDGDGEPQIMDFGLAKRTDDEHQMTTEGAILGTPAYMSPEQARGELENVGPHSDQYSLAVVLFHLLCGEPPLDGPPHSVVLNVAKGLVHSPRSRNRQVDRKLDAAVKKALAANPEDRYPTCAEFGADLRAWLEGAGLQATPQSTVGKLRSLPRQRKLLMALVATSSVLVCLAGFAVWKVWLSGSGDSVADVAPPVQAVASPTQGETAAEKIERFIAGSYSIDSTVNQVRTEERMRDAGNGTVQTYTVEVPFVATVRSESDRMPEFALDVSTGALQLRMTTFEGEISNTSIVQSAIVTFVPTDTVRGPGVPTDSVAVTLTLQVLNERTRTETIFVTLQEEVRGEDGVLRTVTKQVPETREVTFTVENIEQIVVPAAVPVVWSLGTVDGRITMTMQNGTGGNYSGIQSIDRIALTLPEGVTGFSGATFPGETVVADPFDVEPAPPMPAPVLSPPKAESTRSASP